jgi:hypothetical protein
VSLVYWGYSIEDQGSCILFEVIGVMAHIPGYSATSGGPTDEWARSLAAVSGASCGLDGEEAEAFSMPQTSLGQDP